MTAIYHTLSTLDYTCNSLAEFFSFFPKTDLHHWGTFYEASAAADAAAGHGADRHYDNKRPVQSCEMQAQMQEETE